MSSLKDKMKEMAIQSMEFSYSPYSRKKIGAAVLLSNGKIYSGSNIENASYGGTVCAERVAVWKAFSENKPDQKVTEVVVASDEAAPWPPCGFCRQVLAEFATPDTKVTLVNPAGAEKEYRLEDLLPAAFSPEHLLKK